MKSESVTKETWQGPFQRALFSKDLHAVPQASVELLECAPRQKLAAFCESGHMGFIHQGTPLKDV